MERLVEEGGAGALAAHQSVSSPTPQARALRRRDRAQRLDPAGLIRAAYPGALNRRTAMSLVATRPGAPGPPPLEALAKRCLTRDNLVRLRPHAGLEFVRFGRRHDEDRSG